MKTATRIQLINWHYFSDEIISLGDINFLTGANSAGKSTIIDAIQAALMGETRSSYFNRAAGKKSERTFRSYLVGTLGEDVSSGVRALREGKDFSSYVVMEFYDDIKNEHFCLGVVADIYSDGGDERRRFFILDDLLPSAQFIKDGKTVDSGTFIKWCKQNYSTSKFQSFDTMKDYNAAVLRRTNVHDPKVFSMLRKAISFEPISNIEEFITTSICDIEKNIDTYGMQEDIRSYQQTEQQARLMEQRLSALSKICAKYEEILTLRARKKLQQFFIDYGCYQDAEEKLEQAKAEAEALSLKISEYKAQEEQLMNAAEELKAESDRLNDEKNRFLSDSQKLLLEANQRNVLEKLGSEQEKERRLITEINRNAGKWAARCEIMLGEVTDEETAAEIERLQKILKRLSGFSESTIGETSAKYCSDIGEVYSSVCDMARHVLEKYSADKSVKMQEIDRLQDTIFILRKNQKDYPQPAKDLKNAIQKGLSEKYGSDVKVEFLADLIEITDEEWKNAVEGILGNNRMNIIVAPEHFMDAYYIYKRVHREQKLYEYSVVDLEKVFNDKQTVMAGSLAQVVSCEDKYVRAYMDFLLGRVMRCYDDEKIRDYRTSVTRDCMEYRNYSVKPINPYHYSKPFIGRKSIEVQLKQAEDRLALCNAELIEIGNHLRNINAFFSSDWFINQSFINSTAIPAYEAHRNIPLLKKELSDIQESLSRIDTAKLNEIEAAIRENNKEISQNASRQKALTKEMAIAENDFMNCIGKTIPALTDDIRSRDAALREVYSDNFVEQTGKPAYFERLGQYGSPSSVSAAFINPIKQTGTLLSNAEKDLIDLRSNYNHDFHHSFDISNVESNDEFEKEYVSIKDIQLPEYEERIIKAKETAMESFRNDFLNKLKAHIRTAYEQIGDLNRALKNTRFGNNTYRFDCKPNPDYIEYYNMIMAAEDASNGDTLFSYEFMNKYKDTIDNLFAQLESLDRSDAAAAEAVDRLSRYSTYLTFDLLSVDANGITEKLSRTIFSKSGGEVQTPFYVAMLASFAQLYKVKDTRNQMDNTMRLVIFDEAFNKMDPERITESIATLRKFGLQAIICSPTEKAGDIVPLCDRTLLVDKQPDGNGYRSTVVEWKKEMGELQ